MKRIAGAFIVLAGFSGCYTPDYAYEGGDRPFYQARSTAGGAQWARSDTVTGSTDPATESLRLRSGATGATASQMQGTSATMPQLAARPTFPPAYTPPAPTPVQVTTSAGPDSTGVVQAICTNVDPALSGGPVVVTPSGEKPGLVQTMPARQPEILNGAPMLPVETVSDTKPSSVSIAPVSIALDMHSSPAGAPALRLVNSRHFTLSYSMQDTGDAPMVIDLWETRDSRTWRKCDNVRQIAGLCHVEVKDDGVFGYTMVARVSTDKGSTQPRAGDVPQVWVTVDTIKPVVTMSGCRLNLDTRTPNLIILWAAKDRNFGPRPITIFYAEKADGPWTAMATSIKNTGRYECAIPANAPKRAFLRIEAVDLVGNLGSAQSDKSVRLDFGAASAQTCAMAPTPMPTSTATPTLPLPPPTPMATPAPVLDLPRPTVIIENVQPNETGPSE